MAYRNHPTRYLIVKDPAAVAAGRFWAALVSLGKLRPAAHLVKLFFQLSFEAPLRFDRVADSATEGRIYARPSGPSTLFFNSDRIASVGRVAVSRRGVGLSTRPLAARQHIFSILLRGAVALRSVSGSRKAEVRFYVPRFGPSTLFFKSVSLSRSGRARFPVRELGYLPNRHRPVNTFFSTCHSAAAKASLPCSAKWRYTPGPMGCQRGQLHFFKPPPFYHGLPQILRCCAAPPLCALLPASRSLWPGPCMVAGQGGKDCRVSPGPDGQGDVCAPYSDRPEPEPQPLPGRGRRRWWANPAVTDNKEGGYGSALDWRDGTHIIQ